MPLQYTILQSLHSNMFRNGNEIFGCTYQAWDHLQQNGLHLWIYGIFQSTINALNLGMHSLNMALSCRKKPKLLQYNVLEVHILGTWDGNIRHGVYNFKITQRRWTRHWSLLQMNLPRLFISREYDITWRSNYFLGCELNIAQKRKGWIPVLERRPRVGEWPPSRPAVLQFRSHP